MQNYKDLKFWEKAHLFTLSVYEVTNSFPREEIYSLTNQVRRAASSIPANIAEGCGKNGEIRIGSLFKYYSQFGKRIGIFSDSIKRFKLLTKRQILYFISINK